MRSRLLWGSLAFLVLAPAAFAEAPAGSAAPATSTAPAATGAPAPSASSGPAPVQTVTGFGYSTRPVGGARPVARVVRPPVNAPIATLPGFEMESDGSSRLFVQLTQTVPIEQRVAHGQITYVLKGARVAVHNNQNPLETVHFNTPVVRARLVPSGGDLLFVIELRTAATPTWKLDPVKEGGAMLLVDFPKGAYLGAPPPPPPPPTPSASASARRR